MRVRMFIAAVASPLALWAAVPLVSDGATPAEQYSELQERLDRTRERIGRKKGTERVLGSQIAGYTRRIGRLQSRIGTLRGRQDVYERDLSAKRSELDRVRGRLRAERGRIVRLRKRLRHARRALRTRLIEIYKADPPDIVTVILGAKGFADLLEREEFISRISKQDGRIIGLVRDARSEAVAAEQRLDRLEARQARFTAAVQRRRDAIAGVRMDLIGTRIGYARTKAGKSAALRKVRGDRRDLENHESDLEAASRKVAAKLGALRPGGPVKRGSGQWIFPVNGPITGTFGESRPGHVHSGIDFAVPVGTPVRAVDSGKVVLQQGVGASGGYGNYVCIQHGGALASCYAHLSGFSVSSGQRVTRGQTVGPSGNTGNSTGPHLHFEARVNGQPVQPLQYL